jgi:hypothetical protein
LSPHLRAEALLNTDDFAAAVGQHRHWDRASKKAVPA